MIKHQKNNIQQENEMIEVSGARVHNLKNIDISIPKNKLVVITGISGCGKSSLAFDTIYNEGQRRYMETFGAYARQFIGDMERPDVDKITGLSPVISIEQKTTNKNPRSTVGTVTEIYDFLRLLFARIGEAFSYNTGKRMVKWSEEEIVENIFQKYAQKKIMLLAPLVRGRKGHYRELFEEMRKKGFLKMRIDGEIKDIVPKMQTDRYAIHDIELVVDRLEVNEESKARLSQSVAQTMKLGKDLLLVATIASEKKNKLGANKKKLDTLFDDNEINQTEKSISAYSRLLMCEETGISYEEPSPNTFSFNSPYGACPVCKGLGNVYTINLELVLPDKNLSVKEGGIAPLGLEREASVFYQVVDFAKKNKIGLDIPIKDLSVQQLDLLLYGDKGISPALTVDTDDETLPQAYTGSYEGIIPMLKRWFTASGSSDYLREWVEKYMELATCTSCNGQRLKKESLHFKVNGRNIAELGNMNLDNLAAWFDGIELMLDNKQKTIAKDVLKEIRERLQFLLNVGLTYLSLYRPSKSLSGGESQRIRLATQIGSQLQGITYILV